MTTTTTSTSLSARAGALAAALGLTAVLGSACSAAASETGATEPTAPVAHEHVAQKEAAGATPRLAVSYDGGVLVLDAGTLETLDDVDVEGFTRLSPAGDGRHVLVSAGDRFATLDLGAWSKAHGSHAHHYTAEPHLTGADFPASKPGHVVPNGGRTALFDDGDGKVRIFDPLDLADGLPATDTHSSAEAHHGVAVPLPGGGLITTIGTEDSRSGVTVLDGEGREVARNEACPGLHGEAVAQDAVVFGCEDGALVYRDGALTHIPSPDAYGRIGNQAGSAVSDIVLGDYKVEKDAKLERPERVMLVDTVSMTLRPVDLGTSYSFRSLGRGPDGAALVLGADGALHVIDPATGEVADTIAVVAPWTEPDAWQEPRPTLFVEGGTAYVTEPATRSIHAVDLETGAVTATIVLPQTPNELTGVAG